MYKLRFYFVFFILFACHGNRQGQNSKFETIATPQEFIINHLELESITLAAPLKCSYTGFFRIYGNRIYFIDQIFAQIMEFGFEGKLKKVHLGLGDGPEEVPAIQNYAYHEGKHYVFFDWQVRIYQEDWSLERKFIIDWNPTKSLAELKTNPQAKDRGIYELRYFQNRFLFHQPDKVLFHVESTHPKFNGFQNSVAEQYYREAAIIAELDLNTGKVVSLIGHYPVIYQTQQFIPNFSFFSSAYGQENLFVSFNADSLIYQYNQNFKLEKAFGRKGKDMQMNYSTTRSYEQAAQNFAQNRETFAYYDHIEYFPENEVLFRCYQQGLSKPSVTQTRRLQIYQQNMQIADVAIPNGFRIIGYHQGEYYAEVPQDESNNQLKLYKFKLNPQL